LAQLCERWAKERQPTARTVNKYEKAIERFYTLKGRIPIDQIERAHIVDFKDKLRASGVSIPNTNHTLDCLGTLFNFGRDNELVKDNPARGVRLIDNRPTKTKRLPYTLDHLRTIVSKLPDRNTDREGFWLPLLGLYTGARLAELCQLTPSDVRQEAYFDADGSECQAWCVYITVDGDGKRVKTASSIRRFPVHQALIDLGFVGLVQARKGSSRIFDLEPNKDGEWGQDWSKAYGKFLRGTCGIADPKRVFHSFRHTFKEVCRDCDIGKELADAIQGHDDGDSSDSYGGEFYPLRPLVRAMSTYHIKGLELPAVLPAAL
jgi:integrase